MAAESSSSSATAATTANDDDNNNESSSQVFLLPDDSNQAPPFFFEERHVQYIASLKAKLDAPTSLEGALTQHLRMSGIYWSLTALSLLREDITELINTREIVDWVFACFHVASGGFGGSVGHDGHLLYTLSALQILALCDALEDTRLDKDAVIDFVCKLQQPDGSFAGDEWGEIDTRFSYCALSALSILDDSLERVDVEKAADYILQCRNSIDGGFGAVMGAESHAGQVFCCVGALSIARQLHRLDENVDLLAWWLAERQVDSGGLNGRPEKQADVCYSWWILSVLSIMGKVSYINQDKLACFILKCQDGDDGGIADRPDDMADVFHTFFGIAGLSLLGYLHKAKPYYYRQIDPIYALPTDVVKRLGLVGQVMAAKNAAVDERLAHYDILRI